MTGLVHGGNLPVSGASIQLWAVGTGGYGSAATPLIKTTNSYYPGGATGCLSSQQVNITGFTLTSSTVTFTAVSGFVPPVYSYVTIAGLSSPAASGAGLNGQTLIVTASSATSFTAAFANTYAAGTYSDSGTANEVCTTNVITNYQGNFTLSPGGVLSYSCTAGTMLYITAAGGNPGLGVVPTTSTSANNTGLAMMTPIGNCTSLTTNGTSNNGLVTNITINEATTVIGIYALQNYVGITPGTTLDATLTSGTPAFTIGANGTGTKSYQGLINAFELAGNMFNINNGAIAGNPNYTPTRNAATGLAQTYPDTYTAEYYMVDMLANVLAGCVNNASAATSGCTNLFNYATPPGTASAPADTLQAIFDIAQNPTNNAVNISDLATAQAPFAPATTTANDLTIGAGMTIPHPTGLPGFFMYHGFETVIDGFGNIWVSSIGGAGNATGGVPTTNLVAEFDPAGEPIGVTYQYNINTVASPTLSNFSPTQPVSGENNTNTPLSITVDPSNNVWVADYMDGQIVEIPASTGAGVVSEGLTPPGSSVSNAKYDLAYSLGTTTYPSGIAADKNGNIYVTYQGESYSGSGSTITPNIVGLTAASIAQYGYNGSVSAGPLTSATLFSQTSGPGQALNITAATTATAAPSTTDEVATAPTSTSPSIGFPMNSIVFDYSSGYRGQPLAWIPDGNACGTDGAIYQIFGATDTSTTPNITQGEATPLSLMAENTQATCKASTTPALETPIAAGTATYNGNTGATFGPFAAFSAAIDPNSNVWTLNQRPASTAISGYPGLSFTKLTPSYTTTSGVLSGTVTGNTFTSGAFPNMVGGGTASGTHNYQFAIDSAGNVWISGAGNTSVVPGTGMGNTASKTGSFIEFNNSGTDISSQYYQSANSSTPSTSTPTVPAVGSQFGYIGGEPVFNTSEAAGSNRVNNARYNVAIDLGGTLWTAQATSSGDQFNIMLGGAAPTKMPISLGNPSKP